MRLGTILSAALCAVMGLAVPPGARAAEDKVLNIYSARHYPSDDQLYDAFEKETGIAINVVEGQGDALLTRLANEGAASPADVFLTVDAGNLWRTEEAGLFRPVKSDILERRIPANLREPDGKWFGFSKRYRIIAVSKARVAEGAIKTYAELADPKFKGRVCIRSSSAIYNLSLMGALIHKWGAAKAESWARGVVANFARPPQGADTDQLKAIGAGECDVALVNHYYYVRLATSKKPEDKAIADRIRLVFPDQDGDGAHVNIGGAGAMLHAPHPGNAKRFLEFLSSETAQKIFVFGTGEFPAVASAATGNPALDAFGSFKEDTLSVAVYGENQPEAQKVFDRAGWQ